jgi:hypothetical protein
LPFFLQWSVLAENSEGQKNGCFFSLTFFCHMLKIWVLVYGLFLKNGLLSGKSSVRLMMR